MKDIEALPKGLKEKKLYETYQEKLFEITQWYDKQNEETRRIYTRDLDEGEIRHIENSENVLDIRPEQYINLTEAQRRATQAKLTAIEISTNQKKLNITKRQKEQEDKKEKQNEYKTHRVTTSSVSEASSSWSDDSATEDAKSIENARTTNSTSIEATKIVVFQLCDQIGKYPDKKEESLVKQSNFHRKQKSTYTNAHKCERSSSHNRTTSITSIIGLVYDPQTGNSCSSSSTKSVKQFTSNAGATTPIKPRNNQDEAINLEK
ncbi:11784_t:CDS:2 [Racocetra persica]|uniref:11784_t:CDS:1 n=1 Tax=Racocetra persica TaxID=160502 RepID=A0ACA9R070_9GLOM|nr:11784_t:CDS:2 [Racocetra persica]